MKKLFLTIKLLVLTLVLTTKLFAQSNPELINNQTDAKTLSNNFKTHYSTGTFAETGGTLSFATIQNLYNQMVNNHSTNVVYRFGRTASDNTGKNCLLFFNDGATAHQLDSLQKFKSINFCPPTCNTNIDNYIK